MGIKKTGITGQGIVFLAFSLFDEIVKGAFIFISRD